MTHDWMLVETLGSEPAVVAQGAHIKNLIPISTFLRRNPHLMAIQTAIGETVRAGKGLGSITPKKARVIRTELVQMSDGRIHGVQIWVGRPARSRRTRPVVGPLIWDLDHRDGHRHRRIAAKRRMGSREGATQGRAFAEICRVASSIPTRPRSSAWWSSPSRA